jgi:hypothetical protein
MKSIFLPLIVTIGFIVLIAFIFRSKRYGKDTLYLAKKRKPAKKKKKISRPISKAKIMGPENPLWVKMYAEEMARHNTAQTTAVVKKWIKEG